MAEQTTYRVGEDTLSWLRAKKLAGNREVIISGLQPAAVWFVYSVQALISFFLILTGEYFFACLFLALGIAIFCFGFTRQGHGLWFATQWLLLSKDELVFKNNSRWKRSELRSVRVSNCLLPDSVEGGERLGWVIEFENIHSEVQRFETFSQKGFQRLHGLLKAHDLPVEYLT